jgi:citrate lyase subunit beta/citryl-CoA lyase
MKEKYQGKPVIRTLMFTAGHNEKYLNKAFSTEADAIVLDLEDAVPFNKKEEARGILKDFLSKKLPDNRPVYCRINPIDTGDTLLDIDAVACENLNGFIYPTSDRKEDLISFDAQLSLKEKVLGLPKGYFDIIPLIETPTGVLNAQEIAASSSRNIAIIFGSEDFLAEQEGNHGMNARGIEVPRHIIAMTCKANNNNSTELFHIKKPANALKVDKTPYRHGWNCLDFLTSTVPKGNPERLRPVIEPNKLSSN